ncbi:MAG: hypothetical protein EAZ70_00845 [Runella slithyformis]|nr:MAG: hypothetical protein EAY79_01240 [Runella slithyformis]TAF97269.1 MAG: hypothetical protein EAZ46_02630 [Runella sp.]TAG21824.1 MAG: hypothetical protein EAZ38_07235 [Cytophagales bacterium]TAG41012.1 MAG: hypothetical protein EAZ32_04280 [Cytophagia bacterium]TAF29839.1 MAG: hypothetical protein EAZ70_00845 [Runella slithyformis]
METKINAEQSSLEAQELAKKLIASKKKAHEEAKYAMQNPQVQEVVQRLKKRNAERGTPIIRL